MDALTREPAEIRKTSRTRRWGMALLCLLVVAAIGAVWYWPAPPTGLPKNRRDANRPIPVLVATAVQRDTPIFLDGLGTVQAFRTVTVKPMVDGPLLSVNFQEGEPVHKGQVLAQIDPRTYQASLDGALAKKAQDEAQLANAKVDAARYQKLVANNYTSAQQLDTARAQVAQLEAQVRQDQAQIDTARTQLDYTTIVSPIDGRAGIRQVDAGNIVHSSDTTGLVVLTQLQPISVVFTLPQQTLGAVSRAMRRSGLPEGEGLSGMVRSGARSAGSAPPATNPPAVDTADAKAPAAKAAGSEAGGDASGAAQAAGSASASPSPARTTTPAADGSSPVAATAGIMVDGKRLTGPTVLALAQSPSGEAARVLDRGVLTVLDNQVDQTTGTIKLKATFPNNSGLLWPGGFVGVRLQVDTLKGAVVVPPSAIQRGPNGAYVYIASNGTVRRQTVTVKHEDETASVIGEGVKPGEQVVVDGASRLNDGSKVAATEASKATEQNTEPTRASPPGTRRRRGT